MSRSSLRFTLASTVLPVLLLTMAGVSQAATITVTSLLDTGGGTLRDAINTANGTPAAADTINFSVSGTLTLSSALPAIANTSPGSLTIDGSGQTVTIDGANLLQVFSVNTGATLTLKNLTIAHGASANGAGVQNNGTLTISNCTFSNNNATNTGGAVLNNGKLTVLNSAFTGNGAVSAPSDGAGGAIFNGGTMMLTDSTLSSNTTGIHAYGGGIFNDLGAMLTVTDSTFSKNGTEFDYGGGIFSSGTLTVTGTTFSDNSAQAGAGIDNFGTVTVTNSTFAGNDASTFGGALANVVTAFVTNCTFYGNSAESSGGGIIGTPVMLKSSILADESSGSNCGAGSVTDEGYNISDDNSCGFSGTSVNSSTTLNLSPAGLVNNGGPTDTIALEPNSQAVDFIPVADCTDQSSPSPLPVTTDQRGEPRPDPGNLNFCDVGAYELQTSPDFALLSDRVQIARSSAANADQVNMGLTFTDLPNPTCGSDDDVLNNGLTVELFAGSCTDLMGSGLTVDLDPFVVHTVNHESYGTYFLSSLPETVSARMVAVPPPAGTCGEWMLNLEVTGLDTPALGLGGTNPFALILESTDLHVFGCFDIDNAITGNQIVAPTKTVRRGVRR